MLKPPSTPSGYAYKNYEIWIVKLVSSVYGAITGQKGEKAPQFNNSNFKTTAHGGGSAVGYLQGVNFINILHEPFFEQKCFLQLFSNYSSAL